MLSRIVRWFETRVDPFQPYNEAPFTPRLSDFYRRTLWPMRKVLTVSAFLHGLAGILEMTMYYYIGQVAEILSASSPQTLWDDAGTRLGWMGFVALILYPVVCILAGLLINQSYLTPLGAMIRWRTHRQVMRQSLSFFQNDFAGRIAQKIIQTGPSVADSVYAAIDALWYALIYFVGTAVLLSQGDGWLLIPYGAWLLGFVATALYIVPRVGRRSKEMSEARSALTGRIVDTYTNIQTAKLFANNSLEEAYARKGINATFSTFQRQMRLFTLMKVLLALINTLLIAGVMGTSIWLWSKGKVELGLIVTASALVLRMHFMMGWIMWSLTQIFSNIGVTMEGLEAISKPISVTDHPEARDLPPLKGHVGFENVCFQYGQGKGGLASISLIIRPGERVGLVGHSGAGKSTLVNTLLRFYDIEGGRVTLDGHDISRMTQDSLRRQISVVTQDTSLLHRSVHDNIRYARPEAAEDEIIEAAKRARAHEFILNLQDPEGRTGYEAHVGERGVKLSGGQRQRIAIARAILKNAPILVLDEATSALDSEVEAEIQEELLALMEGKTVIAIAHRLSTIAHLDRIIVMEEGHIIEEGSHTALLKQGGVYAGFWRRQSGGFLGLGPKKTGGSQK